MLAIDLEIDRNAANPFLVVIRNHAALLQTVLDYLISKAENVHEVALAVRFIENVVNLDRTSDRESVKL